MRIDWQSLAPNPWFQLCALVAILSGGTMIYNATPHGQPINGDNPTPPPGPPISITTPTPVPVLKAKTHGHWIVDGSGAADADSSDLRVVAGNLADGDVVTVRPGNYQGGFKIGKSVQIIGQGANSSAVSIHASFADTITVSGKNVLFQNLTIGMDSSGDQFHALHCAGESHTELYHVVVNSKSSFGGLVNDNASLDAYNSTFQTGGAGCGLDFENRSRGSMQRCLFSFNRWGLQALNAAHVQVANCAFQNNGLSNGDGWILGVVGGEARADVSESQFTGNTGVIKVSESGSLSVTKSLFKANGVTGEQGNVSSGLIGVTGGAKATLTDVTFESNRQGVSVGNAGSLTVSGCHFSNTGIHTDNEYLQYLSNSISVSDQGSSATVNQGTAISKSMLNGIVIVEGARLTLDDASVESSGINAIYVGNNKGAGTFDVRRGKFSSSQAGLECSYGSSGTIQDSHFLGNSTCGVSVYGSGSKTVITNSEFRGNKNYGFWVGEFGDGQATGCVMDGNERGAQVGVAGDSGQGGTMTLSNCIVTNSTICGIAACVKSTMFISGMRYAGNHKPDIYRERNAVIREDFKNMLVK